MRSHVARIRVRSPPRLLDLGQLRRQEAIGRGEGGATAKPPRRDLRGDGAEQRLASGKRTLGEVPHVARVARGIGSVPALRRQASRVSPAR